MVKIMNHAIPEALLEQLQSVRTQVLNQLVTEEIMVQKANQLDLILQMKN